MRHEGEREQGFSLTISLPVEHAARSLRGAIRQLAKQKPFRSQGGGTAVATMPLFAASSFRNGAEIAVSISQHSGAQSALFLGRGPSVSERAIKFRVRLSTATARAIDLLYSISVVTA
jgi:hypothetical protein